VEELRFALRAIIDRPEIVHALFVASPSLQGGLEYWKRHPTSKKGRQAERAVVRYFARMAGRCTPFGLFSGCSLGTVADHNGESGTRTELSLKARRQYRTITRLDFDYLFALTRSLRAEPDVAAVLHYWPNPTAWRVGNAWYYLQCRVTESLRSYHVVTVECDEYLRAVLNLARDGATLQELCGTVYSVANDSDVLETDARAYINELIRNDVLVARLSPLLTGRQPLDDLIDQTRCLPDSTKISEILGLARDEMAALDQAGIGGPLERYHAIREQLAALPAKPESDHLLQVDLIKPTRKAVLSTTVIDRLLDGVELLCRLTVSGEEESLRSFRDAFTDRYGRARVPLLEAIDEETGIGFGGMHPSNAVLLRGLALEGAHRNRDEALTSTLQKRLMGCSPASSIEMELDLTDLPSAESRVRALPDSFAVTAVLVAGSPEALLRDEVTVHIKEVIGPDGARLMGRFCHADADLARHVREHLAEEEALRPDAIYAEIVYLPEGRTGNVLCRPLLREYEIVYLGRSGAPDDKQLAISDLVVSVSGGRITLHSQRLGREVIPRLTTAHNFVNPRFASAYRFLALLQHQGVSIPRFVWGQLESLDFLPRVRLGQVIVSTARWRLGQQEFDALSRHDGSERYFAVQDLRKRRGLPRWVVLEEGDNTLPIDLDNPLMVDALVHAARRRGDTILREMYPSPEQTCVTGPEGGFCHEVVVPFVRRCPSAASEALPGPHRRMFVAKPNTDECERRRPPGSDWLYAKIYGGVGMLDELLATVLPGILTAAFGSRLISRWFFVRYSDPQYHLRIRFNGAPRLLIADLAPLLADRFDAQLRAGQIWRIQFDTYEREIERYGGMKAIGVAEDLFCADSCAALRIMTALGGDAGLDQRWRIALLGIDAFLTDFGLNLASKRLALERMRESYHREFDVGADTKRQLGDRFRTERRALESLFDTAQPQSDVIDIAREAFAERSDALIPVVGTIRRLETDGRLEADVTDVIFSCVHMHINRLMRSDPRAHELVLYDFLARLYEGQLARRASLV
jgi:thiopeptide-type bacteriocin biosynthesis protein